MAAVHCFSLPVPPHLFSLGAILSLVLSPPRTHWSIWASWMWTLPFRPKCSTHFDKGPRHKQNSCNTYVLLWDHSWQHTLFAIAIISQTYNAVFVSVYTGQRQHGEGGTERLILVGYSEIHARRYVFLFRQYRYYLRHLEPAFEVTCWGKEEPW